MKPTNLQNHMPPEHGPPLTLPFVVRSMRTSDLPAVMPIESRSFPSPWSESAYRYELHYRSEDEYLRRLSSKVGRVGQLYHDDETTGSGTGIQFAVEEKGVSFQFGDVLKFITTESLRSTAGESFPGTVTDVTHRGPVVHVTVSVPPEFICLVSRQSFDEMKLTKGMQVWITIRTSAIHVF